VDQLLLRLHQLARALDERFVPDVHSEGVDRKNAENRQTQLRSRALAAMAACIVARIPDREAAARVTDYFHDDGIDGFAVSAAGSGSPTIYLVQAKWSAAGTHNFTVSETKKLVDGFAKLRDWQQLHLDNRLRGHRDEIYPAMNKTGARVVLIFATSGYNKVSPTTRIETQQAPTGTKPRIPRRGRYLAIAVAVAVLASYLTGAAAAHVFPFSPPTPGPSSQLLLLLPGDLYQNGRACHEARPPSQWSMPGVVQALHCTTPRLAAATSTPSS
jgi:hypothetical protein